MNYTIASRADPLYGASYNSVEAAAEAIRQARGWTRVEVSESYLIEWQDSFVDGWDVSDGEARPVTVVRLEW